MNLSDLGEDGFLGLIQDWTQNRNQSVELGAGDDAAILSPTRGLQFVVSTDAYVEDVHFTRDTLKPDEIGHRVMAGTLSDLAAMGARGIAAFVNLHAPPDTTVDFLRRAYLGMDRVADSCGVSIAGGDTVRGKLAFGITAIGTVPSGEAFRRDGAKRGDVVCVSGELGRSEAGRMLLSGEVRQAISHSLREQAEGGYRSPIPRFDVCDVLRSLERRSVDIEKSEETVSQVRPTAMIDVSDGLALDLGRLCKASRVGCRIESRLVPVNGVARRIARAHNEPEYTLALGGGEDFELLFTVDRGDLDLVVDAARKRGISISPIGEITPSSDGLVLVHEDKTEEPMPKVGYDHFGRSERSGFSSSLSHLRPR